MNEIELKYLEDIRLAIADVYSYLEGKRTFEEFSKNRMLKQAIERNLEIIGEATNNLLKVKPEIEITNARRIVNLRNLLIHAYDSINDTELWAIVINNLPVLKLEVETLLSR
jgi:uncharacterized protein with HEPN domain